MARKIRSKIKQALKAKKGLRTPLEESTQEMDHYIPPHIIFLNKTEETDEIDLLAQESPLDEEAEAEVAIGEDLDYEELDLDVEALGLESEEMETQTYPVLDEMPESESVTPAIKPITPIAFLLKDQIDAFKSMIEAVKNVEANEYKDAVVDILLAKLEANSGDQLDNLMQMEPEQEESAVRTLCDITHTLFFITADRLAVMRIVAHSNKLTQAPFLLARTTELIQYYHELLRSESDQTNQLKIKQILNTLQLNLYLNHYLDKISNLMAIDRHHYEAEILDLVANENPVIINFINAASLPLGVSDVESIKLTLQSLEENLNILAMALFEMIYQSVDNNTLKRFKIVSELVSKQCQDLEILFTLDMVLSKNLKQHGILELYKISHQMVQAIDQLKSTLKEKTNSYSKGTSTFMLRFERGDFFNDNEYHLLKDAVFSIFNHIQATELVTILLVTFARLNDNQKVNALDFIQLFLSIDKNAQLFSSKYEKNTIIERLNMFNHMVASISQSEAVINKLNSLAATIIDKIIFKDQWFSQHVINIKSGFVPAQEMLFRINAYNLEFADKVEDLGALEEQAAEVLAMIESPLPWSTGNEAFTRSFQLAVAAYSDRIITIPTLQEYQNAMQIQLDSPNVQNIEDVFLSNFKESDVNLLSQLTKLTSEVNVNEFNTLLNTFYTQINNGFLNHFKDIEIGEISDTHWLKDDERIKNKLMILAPHIRKFQQYFNINSKFIALSIMYSVESIAHIDPRSKIQHIQAIHEFYEQLTKYAIEKKNVIVALCIHAALEMPYIKRLDLSGDKSLRESLIGQIQHKGLQYSNFVDIVPPISDYLEIFVDAYNKNYKSEIEFYVLTGRKLKEFENQKQNLQQGQEKTDNTKNIYSVLYKMNLIHQPIFYQDILINEKKLMELLKEVSMDMKPTVYEKRALHDFVSLAELKQHLLYCYNRNIDYLLDHANPRKDIVAFIVEHSKESLSDFNDAITILDLIQKIESSQDRNYTEAEQHLAIVLQPYHELIVQAVNSEDYNINEVENFYLAYNAHPKITAIRELPKEKKPFSGVNELKYLIKLLDEHYNEFKRKILIQQEEKRQSTYSELLMKILEGDKQEGFIPFKATGVEEFSNQGSLLPDTEYPVPLAEPEHPDYIGINKTMNFNPAPLPNSVLSIFETKELIQDFMLSFGWAGKIEKLQVLENAKYNPTMNILGIDHLYSPMVQLKVMNLVLVSLDAIGKIAGVAGGYAIHNFTAIKEINDRLNEITQVITSEYADDDIIIARCNRLIHAVYELNQECFALLKEGRPYPIENNTVMNEFCHINEHLVHRLMGIDFRESILTPISTDSDYYKKLSQRARAEIPARALFEGGKKTVRRRQPPENPNAMKDSREK